MIDGEFESFVEKFNVNKIENEKFVETDDYDCCVWVVSIEYAREHMLSLEDCLVR